MHTCVLAVVVLQLLSLKILRRFAAQNVLPCVWLASIMGLDFRLLSMRKHQAVGCYWQWTGATIESVLIELRRFLTDAVVGLKIVEIPTL